MRCGVVFALVLAGVLAFSVASPSAAPTATAPSPAPDVTGWSAPAPSGSAQIAFVAAQPPCSGGHCTSVVETSDLAGAHLSQLTRGHQDENPQWSPDGRRLSFDRFGVKRSIAVMDADGAHLRFVKLDPFWADVGSTHYAWLDARHIVYLSAADPRQVIRADVDTAKTTRIATLPWRVDSWIVHGSTIAFFQKDAGGCSLCAPACLKVPSCRNRDPVHGKIGLWTMPLRSGAKPRFVTDGAPQLLDDTPTFGYPPKEAGDMELLAWSPDGRQILFDAGAADADQLTLLGETQVQYFTVAVATGALHYLDGPRGQDLTGSYWRDGRSLGLSGVPLLLPFPTPDLPSDGVAGPDARTFVVALVSPSGKDGSVVTTKFLGYCSSSGDFVKRRWCGASDPQLRPSGG